MNFGPLSELERDICLLGDVLSDATDAWTLARDVPITPRSLDRMKRALLKAHDVDVQLRHLRAGLHRLVAAAEQERKAS